jgi:hypothetical protein
MAGFPKPPNKRPAKPKSQARAPIEGERGGRHLGTPPSMRNVRAPAIAAPPPRPGPTPDTRSPIRRAMDTGNDKNNPLHRILRGGG